VAAGHVIDPQRQRPRRRRGGLPVFVLRAAAHGTCSFPSVARAHAWGFHAGKAKRFQGCHAGYAVATADTTLAIARALGIDELHAEVVPAGKVDALMPLRAGGRKLPSSATASTIPRRWPASSCRAMRRAFGSSTLPAAPLERSHPDALTVPSFARC
jgi:hypothetical protein